MSRCLVKHQSRYWVFLFFIFFGLFFRAAPAAYGGSQARGHIGAVAVRLRHSHSNARSELDLQPMPWHTEP